MTRWNRATLDKLSVPLQGLVFIVVSFPCYLAFALGHDEPRGVLVWALATGLLNALYECTKNGFSNLACMAIVMLVALDVALVIWNPLRQANLLGGFFVPIAMIGFCIDYGVLKLMNRMGTN